MFSGIILAVSESDHDLLVRMNEKVEIIHKLLSNHLEHHFIYNITLLGAFLATATAVVLWILESRKTSARKKRS